MIPVKKIIENTRFILKDDDPEHNSYKDNEMLMYFNSAVRYIVRTIIGVNPMYLASATKELELKEGQCELENNDGFIQIVDCIIEGKRLNEINPFDIKDFEVRGTPQYYYIKNAKRCIGFYPIPSKDMTVKLVTVPTYNDLTLDDYSPFVNEIDDFIQEYMIIRAGMGDQFNMQQEMSVMQTIYNQIVDLVSMKNRAFECVRSY